MQKAKGTVFLPKILIHSCMIHDTLHGGRKHFSCYCLQALSTEKILQSQVNDCFKINDKQKTKMCKKEEKGEYA